MLFNSVPLRLGKRQAVFLETARICLHKFRARAVHGVGYHLCERVQLLKRYYAGSASEMQNNDAVEQQRSFARRPVRFPLYGHNAPVRHVTHPAIKTTVRAK